MVRIRLRRTGGKGQPSYRLVVTDKESPRDGRFLEIIGFYNPRTQPATIQLKEERVYYWISVGAQPTESVGKILKSAGAAERYQRFKQGEPLDTLVAEAKAAETARITSPKTRLETPKAKPKTKDNEE